MTDYIGREEMREALLGANLSWEDWHKADYAAVCVPAADVRPVLRGKWQPNVPPRDLRPRCSVCGELQPQKTNFCPNCGADMR